MDILTFAKQQEDSLSTQLAELNTVQDELARMGQAFTCVQFAIHKLKDFAVTYTFKDDAEEIAFFKEVKPVFLSQYYYYRKLFAIRLFDSFKDYPARLANYQKLLETMEAYAVKNLAFYQYCMTGQTARDKHYFTRKHNLIKTIHQDEKFSAAYDGKFGKLLANELLKKFILEQIQRGNDLPRDQQLTWTGPKTDLIELIYALHATDVFNKGEASIKRIVAVFESACNISLGDFYRTFQDMRIRKRSQAPFLEMLKNKYVQRLNDIN